MARVRIRPEELDQPVAAKVSLPPPPTQAPPSGERKLQIRVGPRISFGKPPRTEEFALTEPISKQLGGASLSELAERVLGSQVAGGEPLKFQVSPRFGPPSQVEIPAVKGMAKDAVRLAAGLVDFFQTPEGLIAAGLTAAGGGVPVAAYFAGTQAVQIPTVVKAYLDDPTPENLQRALLVPGFAALLSSVAAKGLKGKAPTKEPARGLVEPPVREPLRPPIREELLRPPDIPLADILRREADSLQARISQATGEERVLAEQRIRENREMLAELEGAFRPTRKPVEPKEPGKPPKPPTKGERGSLRITGQLPDAIEVVPRASDLTPLLEFFVSPSQAFGKVHPAAGEIARLTIEATENIGRDTAKAIGEYEKVWRPLKEAESTEVIRLLDNPDVTPETLSIETPPRVREAYIRTRVMLDEQRGRINEARKAAGLPEIEGITEGYWPHVFQGDWGVMRRVGGKWQPIETGWLVDSQVAAVAKAREYLEANPGTRLRVDLQKLHLTPEEATVLPRSSYFRLMNRLSKATAAEIDPISGEIRVGPMGRGPAFEKLKGVARPGGRKPGRAFFGHVQQRRTDLAGWLEDPKALEVLIRGAERYIGMTPLRAQAAKLREQVVKEAPEAGRLHSQLDSYIGAAIEGRPDKLTRSINAAWQHVGERMGLAAKPAALQRASRTVNQIQSMLKLGWSPVSAIVNLTQTINTYSKLGGKYTARGMRDYVTGANKWLIDELGIKQQISKAEEANFRDYMAAQWPRTAREVPHFAWQGTINTALFMFRTAEDALRSTAAHGAYARAIDRKLPREVAISEARDMITETQFIYGPADAPAMLRPAWARVPLQFKTFWVKELEFMFNLKGMELARFFGALTLTAGGLGLPGIVLLSELTELVSGFFGEPYNPLEDLRQRAFKAEGAKGVAARLAVGGVPMAAGVDLMRNIGFQEYLSPTQFGVRSLLGPTGSDLQNFTRFVGAQPGREKQQAWRRFTSSLSPSARRLGTVLGRAGKLIDPRTKQVVIDDLKPWEAFALVLGFTPNRVAQVQGAERAVTKRILEDRSLKGGYVDQVADLIRLENEAYDKGDTEAADRYAAEWEELTTKAEELGFYDIRRAAHLRARTLAKPRVEERIQRGPRRMREELEERYLPPPPEE